MHYRFLLEYKPHKSTACQYLDAVGTQRIFLEIMMEGMRVKHLTLKLLCHWPPHKRAGCRREQICVLLRREICDS